MNILFIGPKFYGYEKAIKEILDSRHEKVLFRDEIPYNLSICYNALKRISKTVAEIVAEKYNIDISNLIIKEKIDTVFIVRGNILSESCLMSIRRNNPNIKLINYQWDSINNNPNGLLISKYADVNYSFDLADVAKYDGVFQHLPLFYSWESVSDKVINKQPASDIFFLGSYHSKRHEIVKELRRQCQSVGLILRAHIYIPRFVYYRKRIIGEKLQRSDVSFRPMSRQDYFHAINNTNIVLDINSPTQTGATMRTIETLSLGRKLISTNMMVRNECFYKAGNIFFWDGSRKLDLKQIIQSSFDHTSDDQILSLTEWLKRIGL